ncbi:DinB family protein [Litchfieldia alkalitelluris]|uniref:DinB family protein n=1 Tax=Litchfieldia alkalitelluris TaxID=304268 RepID=UPI000998A627|nr:DinB family protein [Litchfieldia alkalitelluris]
MNTILNEYVKFTEKLSLLMNIEEVDANKSINEGKWSPKEVIAHIYRWDIFLMEKGIPEIIKDYKINFPSHDQYNAESVVFSKTVDFKTLLKMTAELRIKFVQMLSELNLDKQIRVNGFTHDPHTNQEYTLKYLITGFVEHDQHHFKPLEKCLTRN